MPSLGDIFDVDSLVGALNDIGGGIEKIPGQFGRIASQIAGLPDDIKSALSGTLGGLSEQIGGLGTLWGSLSGLPDQFGQQLAGFGSEMWGGLEGLGGQFADWGGQALGGIDRLGQQLGDWGGQALGGIDRLGQQLGDWGGQALGGIDRLGQQLGDWGQGLGQQIGDWGGQALGGIRSVGDQVSSMGRDLWGNIKDFGGNILDWVKEIPSSIRDAATKGWDTIKGSLGDMGDQISRGWDTVSGLGKDVLSGMQGIGSDLWGGMRDLGSQLGRGISQGWDAVKSGAAQGWDTIRNTASQGWDTLRNATSQGWNAIQGLASEGWDAVRGFTSEGWDALKSGASQGWDAVKNLGTEIAGSIKDGIGGLWNGLKDMMGGISDPITGWIKSLIGRKDRGDSVDTAQKGEAEDAWAEADAERRGARYASGATDENGNEMSVPDSSFNDTTNQGPDGNFLSSGLASLGDASGKLPGDLGDFLSSGFGRIGGLADEFSKLLPGGHGDALFGGQAKWDAEKALSQAMGYQASREARTARLQAEINAKYGVGNGPGAREARAQLAAIEMAQGDAAEGLAFRQADDAYSGGLTQHRAQMQQRGTANSGQDVTGRTKLVAGLFGGRANAAMAGEKAKSDFRNMMDTSRRQTLGTALFDPINTTELTNKRNAVASAKGTAWANTLGDAASSLASAFG